MTKSMTRIPLTVLGLALGAVCAPTAGAQEILPFPPTPSASTAGLTMEDSTYKKRVEPKHLAEGAPNILIILMDDVGPGTPSTYGGEINTPTLDRVAKMGISFNRFHSTAMCSPTRAALLTGRNHTFVGNGQISAIANDFDGFSGIIPKSSATVAEVLKDYGYNTGAWGKWHNTPEEQITSKGPFDYWPTGYGFEYFYGFLAGEASQYEPTLTRNTTAGHRREAQGLPPHRGHRDGRHPLAPRAEGLRTGQAVLHVLGAGRIARPAPDHEGVGRQVQGQVRRRLGQVSRARLRARQGQGLDSAERPAHAAARLHGFLGFDPRGREAVPAPPHGSLRRVYRARRLQRRPGHRRDRAGREARQHADLLHLGRQRLLIRGPERHHQRAAGAERNSDQDLAAHRGAERTRRPRCARRSRRPTTCTTPAGRGRAARRTRAPSSWAPTSAARASRWPSPGRSASRPIRRRGRSSTT